MYTLIDVVDHESADDDTIVDGYHYSCLSDNTSCEEVVYFYNGISYYKFRNGEKFDSSFKDKMFNVDNTNDSNAKTVVDGWYSSNMLNVDNLIEDTVYCDDRTVFDASGSFTSKD